MKYPFNDTNKKEWSFNKKIPKRKQKARVSRNVPLDGSEILRIRTPSRQVAGHWALGIWIRTPGISDGQHPSLAAGLPISRSELASNPNHASLTLRPFPPSCSSPSDGTGGSPQVWRRGWKGPSLGWPPSPTRCGSILSLSS